MKHITRAQQEAREGTTDLRRNTAQAAAEGELERAERQTYCEAVRARAIELWTAGYKNEARALVEREFGICS